MKHLKAALRVSQDSLSETSRYKGREHLHISSREGRMNIKRAQTTPAGAAVIQKESQ